MNIVAVTGISQEAQEIGPFGWTAADPVSLSWRVNVDWSGTYVAQIRKARKPTAALIGTFTVTAVFDSLEYPDETLFTMVISEADSLPILAGKYVADIQQVGGVTRVWGTVKVGPQVTVIP